MCVKLKMLEADRLLGGAWAKIEMARRLLAEAGENGASIELRAQQENVQSVALTLRAKRVTVECGETEDAQKARDTAAA